MPVYHGTDENSMGFIKLNRYGDPSGSVFDVEAVVCKARETFTGVNVLLGDQLAFSAERAAAVGARTTLSGLCDGTSKIMAPLALLRSASRGLARSRDAHVATMSHFSTPTRCPDHGGNVYSHSCKA